MRKLTSASGIVSAIVTVLGLIILIYEEIDSRTDQEIIDYYGDRGNRILQLFGFCLVLAGAMLFLVFLSELRGRLQGDEVEPNALANLVLAAGAAAAPLLVVAAAMLSITSAGVQFSDEFEIAPNLARYMVGAGYLMFTGSVLVNCVTVFATSLLVFQRAVFPRWLGWVGLALIVIAIAEAFLLAVFTLPVWVLIVSVVMLTRPPVSSTTDG